MKNTNKQSPSEQHSLLEDIRKSYQSGNLEEVVTLCGRLLKKYPDCPEALVYLGQARGQLGELQESAELIQKAVALRPETPAYYYYLGNALAALGKQDAAVQACRHAVRLAPNLAEAYFFLGGLLHENGDLDGAEQAYLDAIRSKPGHVRARHKLADLLKTRGRIDEAIKAYKAALQINPRLAIAYYSLASAQKMMGYDKEAGDTCRRALQLVPDTPRSCFSIGYARLELDQLPAARESLLHALEMKPDMAEAYYMLGNLEQKNGDQVAAIKYYRQALTQNPGLVPCMARLASLLEKSNKLDEAGIFAVKGLAKAPENASLLLTHAKIIGRQGEHRKANDILFKALSVCKNDSVRSEINLRIGQNYDYLNDPVNAFRHFSDGKQIDARMARDKGINKQVYLDGIDAISKLCTRDLAKATAPAFASAGRDFSLVFLVGFPRSGTTLLQQMLDSHPEIETMEERPAVAAMLREFYGDSQKTAEQLINLDDSRIAQLRDVYFEEAGKYQSLPSGGIFIDKLPLNIHRAHFIWRVFPEARFIFAVRHPCDVCLSCFMQGFDLNQAMANFFSLEDTVSLYDRIMGYWCNYVEMLPVDYHTVRYEDLVSGFEPEIKQLLDYLGAGWDDGVRDYMQHARSRDAINTPSYHQVVRPLYKHATNRWHRYKPFFEPFLTKLSPFVDRFGYRE